MTTDITQGIPREGVVHFCRGCERYLQPPHGWVNAQPESKELLALCLKKLRGLNKVSPFPIHAFMTGPFDRCRIHLDGTPLPSSSSKTHRPERSFHRYNPPTNI